MPYAGINGQRLYYEVSGDGDPLVLLHGVVADADIVEAPATGLASGFRAIRYDRRGHGRSTVPESGYALADYVDELRALLDWFGIDKCHFLGHDAGGSIAIEFALTYPNRLLYLGLLAPSIVGHAWSAEWTASWDAYVEGVKRGDPKLVAESYLLPRPMFDGVRGDEGRLDRVSKIYTRQSGVPYAAAPVSSPSQIERLSEIKTRAAVFVGDADEPDFLKMAETVADGIPGCQLVTFPGLGHFLHMEDARAIMRRLTDFFLPDEA